RQDDGGGHRNAAGLPRLEARRALSETVLGAPFLFRVRRRVGRPVRDDQRGRAGRPRQRRERRAALDGRTEAARAVRLRLYGSIPAIVAASKSQPDGPFTRRTSASALMPDAMAPSTSRTAASPIVTPPVIFASLDGSQKLSTSSVSARFSLSS